MGDKHRFILGYIVVGGAIILALAFALGKVEEKSSYGLSPVLLLLGKVALDFSEWAYKRDKVEKTKEEKDVHNT